MKVRVTIALIFFFSFSFLRAVVKGSETAVSVEASATFPAADNDNTMLGFGWFKNGFILEDLLTTCSFNDVFPVSGTVNLNGGTLRLQQDLLFSNVTTLQGLGKVIGNGHELHLSQSISQLPSDSELFEDVHIFCDSNVDLLSTITFRGNCTICGNGNFVRIGRYDAEIIVDVESVLEFRDVVLCHIKETNLRCVDDTGSIILDNLRWVQTDSFIWGNGNLLFRGVVDLIGSSTFTYSSICTSTIDICSQLTIDNGMYFSLGRDETTLRDPLVFTDETSVMKLNNCSLIITGSGVQFTKGEIVTENAITIDIAGTTTETGLIFGDDTAANDILISVLSSSAIKHNSGYLVYNNYSSDKLVSSYTTASLVRNLNSKIYLNNDLTIQNLTIELLSQSVPAIEFASGKSLSYESACVRLPDAEYDLTCNQSESNTYLLNGNCTLFMTKGIIPINVSISGSGNKVQGSGSISGTVALLDSGTEITSYLSGFIKDTVTLNDGTFTLSEDLQVSNGVMFGGDGTINLGSYDLTFGSEALAWSGNTYWSGSGGAIHLNSDVSLVGTWTFSGNVVLHGNDQTIDLGSTGNIFVNSNSSVMFHGLRLENVSDENIQCIDDTAVIMLDDATWCQPDSSSCRFDAGSLRFIHKVLMSGNNSLFVYSTSETSTICAESRLVLDANFTFSYDPGTASKGLLEFEKESSKLVLKSASLHSTATGMQLTKGKLEVKGDSYLSSEKIIIYTTRPQYLDEGISFGSGTVDDDFTCVISEGSTLSLVQGTLVYNNTVPNLLMFNNPTTLLSIAGGARLVLDESLQLTAGGIEFGNHATLTIANGKTFTGSIFPLGYLHRLSKS